MTKPTVTVDRDTLVYLIQLYAETETELGFELGSTRSQVERNKQATIQEWFTTFGINLEEG